MPKLPSAISSTLVLLKRTSIASSSLRLCAYITRRSRCLWVCLFILAECSSEWVLNGGFTGSGFRIKERRDCGVAPDLWSLDKQHTHLILPYLFKTFLISSFSYFPADRTCVCTGAAAERQGSSDPRTRQDYRRAGGGYQSECFCTPSVFFVFFFPWEFVFFLIFWCVLSALPGLSGGTQTRPAETPGEPKDAVWWSLTDTGSQYLPQPLTHTHTHTLHLLLWII